MSKSEGCENKQECGPRGESAGEDNHGSRGGACGSGWGRGTHVGDEAGCADSVYTGETLLPPGNSSTEFRRLCRNVQGPWAENTTVGGTQMAPVRM